MKQNTHLEKHNKGYFPQELNSVLKTFFLTLVFCFAVLALLLGLLFSSIIEDNLIIIIPIIVVFAFFSTPNFCLGTIEYLKIKTINREKDNKVLKAAYIFFLIPYINFLVFSILLLIKKKHIKSGPFTYDKKIKFVFGSFLEIIFGHTKKGIAKTILFKGLLILILEIGCLIFALLLSFKVINFNDEVGKLKIKDFYFYIYFLLAHILMIVSYIKEIPYVSRKTIDNTKDNKYKFWLYLSIGLPIINFIVWTTITFKKLKIESNVNLI
ncbi:hypothetical protein SGLAD_v1c03130 [Spiroplasma gladiatoris]|uniref:Uncharacterized protein n=1 Tax=Spiroplasma gladiatoris TaxID=2143 RepID=A0A4P7AH63_9MOLU|nr:hypothetical protein [Spiroplasma gladiatoris]QBQ07512.1 hypothetical protein SGLAD_v1c03130 [Spiroplasma gladiatoris]